MKHNPSPFQLQVITDGIKQLPDLIHTVKKTLEGGADAIQLRYKSAPASDLWTIGQELLPIVQHHQRRLLINDRIDVALAIPAHGVHLAGKSLPPKAARTICKEPFLIGCSIHSIEEAKQAEQQGVSYITFGHIFSTKSKPGMPPRGIEALYEVVSAISIPVFAIGGIHADNIADVLQTGCAGIAVIGAVMNEQNPEKATYELKNRMIACQAKPKVTLPPYLQ
ncbi:thiamine phosphate synthase [Fodinisporobacter ferrooxydans]|uniref:Thiamine-phosphate synthase n=1 Tax=Fodinisporobacter ferrooxydans TaxID=2901836 RepID=A0ABY4CIU3_9BACL|nr:thiamine phosphate synthase [Alicyclobacillaceae bacterium MYW30-H2]